MGRESEISSKTVTARLPMNEYIKLLQTASAKKQSVSEYVMMCIYGAFPETIENYEAKVNSLVSQITQAHKDQEKLNETVSGLTKQAAATQKKLNAYSHIPEDLARMLSNLEISIKSDRLNENSQGHGAIIGLKRDLERLIGLLK